MPSLDDHQSQQPAQYRIVLSPALGISPDELVALWNVTTASSSSAQATVERTTAAGYDPALLGDALVVLRDLAVGVTGNVLYELLKQLVARRGLQARLRELPPAPDSSPSAVSSASPSPAPLLLVETAVAQEETAEPEREQ